MLDPYTAHEHPEFVPECFRDEPHLAIEVLIVTAHCCRDWPVLATAPIGRCGICGERPVVVWDTDRENPRPSAR